MRTTSDTESKHAACLFYFDLTMRSFSTCYKNKNLNPSFRKDYSPCNRVNLTRKKFKKRPL